MKRIAQGLIVGVLVFSFFGFLPIQPLAAQDTEGQIPKLTEQELQQFQDLQAPATDSGYDYSGGSAPSLGGGGLNTTSILLGVLGSMFGGYIWILVVLYFLLLLCIAFILYASVFKRFKRFSREQALVFAWNETKKHIWFFVLITLIQIIIYAVLFILLSTFFTISPYLPIPILKDTIPYAGYYATALSVVFLFFFLLFIAGTTKISLKFTDGTRANVGNLFTAITYLPKLILAAILYWLIIFSPSILLGTAAYYLRNTLNLLQLGIGATVLGFLLAIPVAHLILKFYLYYIVVIDKGVWPIKALKIASQYSKGAKTDLSLFLVLLIAITSVGSNVPLMLGLFMAAPLTSLALTHAYRQLEKGTVAE